MKLPSSTGQILSLQGTVQHYDWGGYSFLPDLLGLSNPNQQPFAEYWIGSHPLGDARVKMNREEAYLSAWIRKDPSGMLGEKVARQFGELPFLLKVLDVRKMLSIQAHPEKKVAEEGFARENRLGIPLHSPNRVYKDANHKPEIMVALSDFWLLHGFRPEKEIARILDSIPEFRALQPFFRKRRIFDLYHTVMHAPQQEIDAILDPLKKRLEKEMLSGTFSKDHSEFWATLAFREFCPTRPYDRGILSIFIMNLVHLSPGEGIFQGPGVLHAYLEGTNVELMANSDNVFRGGLTHKHIAVEELLRHLDFQPVAPKILKGIPRSDTQRVYPAPVPDFELSRIAVDRHHPHRATGSSAVAILLATEGMGSLNGTQPIQKGDAFLIPPHTEWQLESQDHAVLFGAAVPEI